MIRHIFSAVFSGTVRQTDFSRPENEFKWIEVGAWDGSMGVHLDTAPERGCSKTSRQRVYWLVTGGKYVVLRLVLHAQPRSVCILHRVWGAVSKCNRSMARLIYTLDK